MTKKRIIIIEDDETLSLIYQMFLKDLGHELVGIYSSAQKLFDVIDSLQVDLALVDIKLGSSLDGIKIAAQLKTNYNIPSIYITGHGDTETVEKALESNPYGYLLKPVDKKTLRVAIELAFSKFDLEQSIEKQIVEGINVGVLVTNKNGNLLFANKLSRKLFSMNDKFLGKSLSEYLFEEHILFDEAFIKDLIKHKEKEIDIVQRRGTDKERFLSLRFSIFLSAQNEPMIYCFIYDVTDKRRIEQQTQSINAGLRTIFDKSDAAIYLFDKDFFLVDFNQRAHAFINNSAGFSIMKDKKFSALFTFLLPAEQKQLKKMFAVSFEGIEHDLTRRYLINNKEYHLGIKIFPISTDAYQRVNYIAVSVLDETENYKLKNELEELQTEIKPLFDSSFQRFYLCDLQYRIVAFNKSAADLILKEFNHILKRGDSILNFVADEVGIDSFKERFSEALQDKRVSFKVNVHSNAGNYWKETHFDPILNAKGEIIRVLIWTVDITEQEQNKQVLNETKERYALIAQSTNDGLWDWNVKTNEVELSDRWKMLLGYQPDELENEFGVHDSLLHSDDLEKSHKALEDLILGKTDTLSIEIRLFHKKGYYIWVKERGIAVKDENGEVQHVMGSITDITPMKKAEQELIRREKRYQNLLKAIPDLFFIVDDKGNYVDYNVDPDVPLAVNPDEVIGKNLKDFFDEETRQKMLEKIRETIKTEEMQTMKYELPSKLGVRKFEARLSKYDSNKVLSIVRDLTQG